VSDAADRERPALVDQHAVGFLEQSRNVGLGFEIRGVFDDEVGMTMASFWSRSC